MSQKVSRASGDYLWKVSRQTQKLVAYATVRQPRQSPDKVASGGQVDAIVLRLLQSIRQSFPCALDEQVGLLRTKDTYVSSTKVPFSAHIIPPFMMFINDLPNMLNPLLVS